MTHEDVGQECIESESMLPPHPFVCNDCGHIVWTDEVRATVAAANEAAAR